MRSRLATPAAMTAAGRPASRFTVPRGLLAGTLVATALAWGPYAIDPKGRPVAALVQSGIYAGLLVLTVCSRRAKVLLIRTVQRWTINPAMRLMLALGINPLGLAILETRGHRTGKTRRVPVGNGRKGSQFWIIAEHGMRAGYVQNIARDPYVRVRLRIGWRYRWVPGIATLRPDDDPLARQRRIIAWHPLRALNAINVRTLGADLLTVHVQLDLGQAGQPRAAASTGAPAPLPVRTGPPGRAARPGTARPARSGRTQEAAPRHPRRAMTQR